MNQINQQIGHKIKNKRKKLGITQANLSKKLSISPAYLNLMESGKRKIDLDLLLKIVDASSNFLLDHILTIDEVLNEMEMQGKKSILVFNKIDFIKDSEHISGLKKRFKNAIFISSLKDIGILNLKNIIIKTIRSDFNKDIFKIPYKNAKLLDTIYTTTNVINKKDSYSGIELEVEGSKSSIKKIRKLINKKN